MIATGSNVDRSVSDLSVLPPAEWVEELRAITPITDKFSWLMFYWFNAGQRWVLYDCQPVATLGDPESLLVPGFSVKDFFDRVNDDPPSKREAWDYCPYVSELQYALYHKYKVYARPFWVLQGNNGGHQVAFSPWQQQILATKGLPPNPPEIGSLPACPFDNRVKDQLRKLNRLKQFDDSLAKMRESGDVEGADKALAAHQKEIRAAELEVIEKQYEEMVDCASHVAKRADSRDHLIYVPDGTAGLASEALEYWKETGDFLY